MDTAALLIGLLNLSAMFVSRPGGFWWWANLIAAGWNGYMVAASLGLVRGIL